MKYNLSAIVVVAAIATLAACGDSEQRMLETGKKNFASADYKSAVLDFKRLLQKNPQHGDAYYHLGLTELRLGRYVDALRSLRRATELRPDNEDAGARLGELYLMGYMANREKNKQLLVDLADLSERMLTRNPKSVDGLRMQGYVASAKGDQKSALNAFEEAIHLKPDSGALVTTYVQSLAAAGREEEAEKIARDFIARDKTYGPIYDFLYLRRISRKELSAAEQILKEKIANNPKHTAYVIELAVHHLRSGKRDLMKSTLDTITSQPQDYKDGRSAVGDFYLRIGDFSAAHQEYSLGIKESPEQKALFQKRLIELLAVQGRNQEAMQVADTLVKDTPDDDQAKAMRASLRLRGGDPAELDTAISEFQSVVGRMPDNAVVRFNYGEALLAKGQMERAQTQFMESLKHRPSYMPSKIALTRIALLSRDFPRALTLADEVLRLQPNMVSARVMRANALVGTRDLAAARTELETTIKVSPDSRDARYLLALIDFNEKRYREAETAFRGLWEANPPDSRGLFGLVEVLAATNRAPVAEQMLQKVLNSNPADPHAVQLAIGSLAVRTAEYDKAISIFQDLTRQRPKNQDLWLRLGETYRRASRYDEALKAFETARDINPNQVTPWLQIAMVMEATNRSGVRPIYEQILKLAPDHPVALNNLAYLLADSGSELDHALALAKKAMQKAPGSPDVADTLGWIYIRKHSSDEAIKIFQQLLERQPKHVTWRYHLAMALYQKGDKLQARKELETALQHTPTQDENHKIRELLSRIG